MRALVTGGNGFVGRHLVAALRERGDEVVVAGRPHDGGSVDLALELGDAASVREVVAGARAEVVFHLAGIAFVPEASADPLRAYDINALGTVRLIEALRSVGPAATAAPLSDHASPRLIYASSGEVYGVRVPGEMPLDERVVPQPVTPYAASKLAAEAIVLAAHRTYGIPGIVARPFNHIGPGQDARFAAAGFAQRLAEIAAGAEPVLLVGNLEAQRDFTDVRDVVRAYLALVERGAPGEVYNVASGSAVPIRELLRRLITIAHVPVEIREDPARLRPSDAPLICGSSAKLRAATGWAPAIPLERSLRDAYDAARARLAGRRAERRT
ncbi:MAG: NAD-dependent epimerase/dehydratase family protein [Vulcanimicrobiaceae bacterium]